MPYKEIDRNTCKEIPLARCLCAIIGRGSEGEFLLFVYEKKCASLFVATWLLAWPEKQYKS